jgi:CRISPR-associated protein Cmr2
MQDHDRFWKDKLAAWLHDPPGKPFDIAGHYFASERLLRGFGLTHADFPEHGADHVAAAADRFAFPHHNKLRAGFTGAADQAFRHPFGGGDLKLDKPPFATGDSAEDEANKSFTGDAITGAETWKEKFWLLWRRWPEQAAEHDSRLAFLPADTRIPDHSIWNHNSMVSALQGCMEGKTPRPAFLLFQCGPVQGFISEARSTRDLWSGSYLLSWLIAHALYAIADRVGPDAVIFPALRGQPLFDSLNRSLWDKIKFGADTLWSRMYPQQGSERQEHANRLLSPTLPNRFLALVPAGQATALAQAAADAFRAELRSIAATVWENFAFRASEAGHAPGSEERKRFDAQIELWPQLAWQVVPWDDDKKKVRELWDALPKDKDFDPVANHDALETLAEKAGWKGQAANGDAGKLWAAHVALTDYALAARRNTRDFAPYNTDDAQSGALKDPLTGREEVIGSKELWKALRKQDDLFKKETQGLGALSIVKRLWCRSDTGILTQRLGLSDGMLRKCLQIESVEEIAKGNTDPSNPYVALLALDGDEMGKWISGAKLPTLKQVFAKESATYFDEATGSGAWQSIHRPLSPSYHLQFSEALSVFATRLVEPIVRAYGGELILAGGDDVLAILPASKALDCAAVLRAAFRGEAPEALLKVDAFRDALPEADLPFDPWTSLRGGWLMEDGEKDAIPRAMPGPLADVSAGIAVGHFKHPLQQLVQAAQAAEKSAKTALGRAACHVRLLKRGGEEIQWGFKWSSGALALYHRFSELTRAEKISGRFPHAFAERFAPYGLLLPGEIKLDPGFAAQVADMLALEFAETLGRQGSGLTRGEKEDLAASFGEYLETLGDDPKKLPEKARDIVLLFLASAFMHRQRGEEP